MNKEICNGKNSVLKSCRNSKPEDAVSFRSVNSVFQITETEGAVVGLPSHVDQNEHCGYILRDDTGECNAVLRHVADDDKKQVEHDVQKPRDHQIGKRTLRVSVRAEHAVTEVEDSERGHSERIDAEIEDSPLDEILLRAEQLQHEPRGKQAEHRDDTARCKADDKRGADGSRCTRLFASAEVLRHADVDGTSHSDEEARKQGDQNGG